jgi:hypothetical protein
MCTGNGLVHVHQSGVGFVFVARSTTVSLPFGLFPRDVR